ncbi:MAG: ABC transporter permease [Thermoleophilaceae bacterium]
MSAQGAAQPRYRGPAAIGDDLRRFWNLTYMLAATDFKLRFFGSALGYLWTLARPLLLFGTLYFVFTKIVKFGEGVRYYPVYLLSGIVLFTFFSETTSRGVTALIERENLLRKMRFPRMVIPLSVALHSLFNLGLNLIVVFIFIFASGITPTLDWVQIPLLIGMLVILATGATMLLSALYVRFRDVEPIWEVALQLLFYGTPIIYVIERVPESVRELVMFNPIASILTQWRHAVIDQDAPTAGTAIGGIELLAVPVLISVAVLVLGWWVFMRETPRIAENL